MSGVRALLGRLCLFPSVWFSLLLLLSCWEASWVSGFCREEFLRAGIGDESGLDSHILGKVIPPTPVLVGAVRVGNVAEESKQTKTQSPELKSVPKVLCSDGDLLACCM